jgi:hypothetical protein
LAKGKLSYPSRGCFLAQFPVTHFEYSVFKLTTESQKLLGIQLFKG